MKSNAEASDEVDLPSFLTLTKAMHVRFSRGFVRVATVSTHDDVYGFARCSGFANGGLLCACQGGANLWINHPTPQWGVIDKHMSEAALCGCVSRVLGHWPFAAPQSAFDSPCLED